MEVDAAYQGCLPSCKLHSRSLAVRCTGACDLEIAHMRYAISRLRTCVTQSRDCLRNLGIPRMRNAISRLCKFPDCTEHKYLINYKYPMNYKYLSKLLLLYTLKFLQWIYFCIFCELVCFHEIKQVLLFRKNCCYVCYTLICVVCIAPLHIVKIKTAKILCGQLLHTFTKCYPYKNFHHMRYPFPE